MTYPIPISRPHSLVQDHDDPDVVYVGHDGRILERIEAVFSRWWHRVSAPIQHFSGYSIAL